MYICICMYIYKAQAEDGSKKLKHVTESCKFVKYLMQKLC